MNSLLALFFGIAVIMVTVFSMAIVLAIMFVKEDEQEKRSILKILFFDFSPIKMFVFWIMPIIYIIWFTTWR